MTKSYQYHFPMSAYDIFACYINIIGKWYWYSKQKYHRKMVLKMVKYHFPMSAYDISACHINTMP